MNRDKRIVGQPIIRLFYFLSKQGEFIKTKGDNKNKYFVKKSLRVKNWVLCKK